jgi:probable Rubsico expression protein CbbX
MTPPDRLPGSKIPASRMNFGMSRPGGNSAGPESPEEAEKKETLAPDAKIDLAKERAETGIDDVFSALDSELVGLAPVKNRIREIAALLLVDRARAQFGLSTSRPSLHMCFTGSPGTGKTTVAMRMADLLYRLGYLRRGHLVSATRDDLVGQYVGHTAPKTKEVLKRAMGGVLFIDEAYYLYREDNERDYGQETIEILLQVMENQREDLVVILAGYKDRMDSFFVSNPGMSSRIAHHIDFPDYTLDELDDIGKLMIRAEGYQFSPEAEKTFREYLDRRMKQPRFANARSVRNAIERARLRHASRLMGAEQTVGKDELTTLLPEDFRGSRVFANSDSSQDSDDSFADPRRSQRRTTRRRADGGGTTGPQSPSGASSRSTMTGAWSLGAVPLRAWRSTQAAQVRAATASPASTRSMRIPRSWWNMPAR